MAAAGDSVAGRELPGVYHGIVTQNDDTEGSGGRVKLRLPWLQGSENEQTKWAPLVMPMVGKGFGSYVLPDVGDAVLVMFLAGDVDHPVVIGGVWSTKDAPPETNTDGKNDFRVMKSRAGNRVLFDDSPSGKVVLNDASQQHLVAVGVHRPGGQGRNATPVATAPTVTTSGGQGVSIAALSGALEVLCPDGALRIEAPVIEVTAADGLDLSAGGDLSLNASGTMAIGASGPGVIAGGLLKLGAG